MIYFSSRYTPRDREVEWMRQLHHRGGKHNKRGRNFEQLWGGEWSFTFLGGFAKHSKYGTTIHFTPTFAGSIAELVKFSPNISQLLLPWISPTYPHPPASCIEDVGKVALFDRHIHHPRCGGFLAAQRLLDLSGHVEDVLQPQLSASDAFEVARGVDDEDIRQVIHPGICPRILSFLGGTRQNAVDVMLCPWVVLLNYEHCQDVQREREREGGRCIYIYMCVCVWLYIYIYIYIYVYMHIWWDIMRYLAWRFRILCRFHWKKPGTKKLLIMIYNGY